MATDALHREDSTKPARSGLVTLPGAFVGVLLGGGTPIQAGAAQLLVLVGLLATQTITVVVFARLVRSGRLLSPGSQRHVADLTDIPAGCRAMHLPVSNPDLGP